MLMAEFMKQGTTITSEVYPEILNESCRAIEKKKQHGMLIYGVVLLRDNAHSHAAARAPVLTENFNWELFDHSPLSSDLISSY
jgi:hypothetical protein